MTDVVVPGLREQKRIATRRALRLALFRMALDRGFDAVTIEEVALAAGVSPRTFFNYFASKEEAVAGTDQPFEITDEARERFLSGTADVLTDLVEMIADNVDDEDEFDLHKLRKQLVHREPRLLGMQVVSAHRFNESAASYVAERVRAETVLEGGPVDEGAILDRAGLVVMTASAVARHGWSRWVSAGGRVPLAASIRAGYADFRAMCAEVTEPAPA